MGNGGEHGSAFSEMAQKGDDGPAPLEMDRHEQVVVHIGAALEETSGGSSLRGMQGARRRPKLVLKMLLWNLLNLHEIGAPTLSDLCILLETQWCYPSTESQVVNVDIRIIMICKL